VRTATVDDLAKAPGMNRKAAEQVARYFVEIGQQEHDGARLTENRAEIDADFDANVEGRLGVVD